MLASLTESCLLVWHPSTWIHSSVTNETTWNDLDFPLNQSPCEVLQFSMSCTSGVTWHARHVPAAHAPPCHSLRCLDVWWLCFWGRKNGGKGFMELPFYLAYTDWMEARTETWLKINGPGWDTTGSSKVVGWRGKGSHVEATLKNHMDLTLKIHGCGSSITSPPGPSLSLNGFFCD